MSRPVRIRVTQIEGVEAFEARVEEAAVGVEGVLYWTQRHFGPNGEKCARYEAGLWAHEHGFDIEDYTV